MITAEILARLLANFLSSLSKWTDLVTVVFVTFCFCLVVRANKALLLLLLLLDTSIYNCPRRVLAQRPKPEEALIGPPAYKECEILV